MSGRTEFLAGLPLAPETLPRPLPPPGPRDFVICGCPKTGTTLLAATLWQPPRVVVCSEPWDGMRMPPATLFGSLRRELRTGRLGRGRLDVPHLLAEHEVRWTEDGERPVRVMVDDGHLLGVKWPAFWRYLPLLPDTKFLVCLRHPYEVVHSFEYSSPTLREGYDYDTAFNRALNARLAEHPDTAVRRVKLYDAVNAEILRHLGRRNVLPVRHERWYSEPDALVDEVAGFLGVELAPGLVRLRRPRGGDAPEVRDLVRTHCTTAHALGYTLD
ncbi:sulfotransferase [Actinomadura fulvescens]|uniref:Sulfotransferase n=1 Tax=Actinomadura fulvescens TaxID=46160 RepID=A0ABP6CBS6_9ACTN